MATYLIKDEQGQHLGGNEFSPYTVRREAEASARRAVQQLGMTVFVLRDGDIVSLVERSGGRISIRRLDGE